MHIKFNILLFLPVIPPNALDFLDFETLGGFYLIAGFFFWGLRFNDLLQCMEKHEHSQREELVVTLVEITQKGKKLNILEIWKNYFLQVPLLYPKRSTIYCFAYLSRAFFCPLAMNIIFKKYTISA